MAGASVRARGVAPPGATPAERRRRRPRARGELSDADGAFRIELPDGEGWWRLQASAPRLRPLPLEPVESRGSEPTFWNATAMAAAHAAEALRIGKIVCFTESGNTVRLLSRYRTPAEIIALTPSRRTLQAMTVLSQVRPILFEREGSLEDMLHAAQTMLLDRRLALMGEEIVFVAGVPPGVTRSTNVVKLHRIGEATRLH